MLQHSRLQTPSKHGQALPLRRVSLRESVIPTARQTITPNVSSTQQIAASFLLTQLTLLISEMNGRFATFLTMASCLLTLPTPSLTSDIEAFQYRSCCISTTYVVKSPSTTNSPCSHYVSRDQTLIPTANICRPSSSHPPSQHKSTLEIWFTVALTTSSKARNCR